MSKESDECYTPIEIIRALGEFDLDPACGVRCKNKTAKRRFTKNGLERKWFGRVWLNPPFSQLQLWSKKFHEHGNGVMLVCFVAQTRWMFNLLAKSKALFLFSKKPVFTTPAGTKTTNRYYTALVPLGGGNVEAIRKANLPGI